MTFGINASPPQHDFAATLSQEMNRVAPVHGAAGARLVKGDDTPQPVNSGTSKHTAKPSEAQSNAPEDLEIVQIDSVYDQKAQFVPVIPTGHGFGRLIATL